MRSLVGTIEAFAQDLTGLVVTGAKLSATIAIVSVLSACSMTGKSLDDASIGVSAIADDTMLGGTDPFNTAADAEGSERDRLLDEDTIRNAVTSADLHTYNDEPLGWANQSTGSKGTITGIRQREVAGQTCRSFSATREAYDGVTLYQGDLCLDRRTGWWTRMLAPAGADSDS